MHYIIILFFVQLKSNIESTFEYDSRLNLILSRSSPGVGFELRSYTRGDKTKCKRYQIAILFGSSKRYMKFISMHS